MNGDGILAIIVCGAFVACLGIAALYRSEDRESAQRVLEDQGYSSTVVERGNVFGELTGCGTDEIAFDATADNANGKRVSLKVCCGVWLKACTVRSR